MTVTDGVTGCAKSGSGTATVNALPTASVNSAAICAGGSATLTATSSASSPSYAWSPGGATTASITVSPSSTTTYTVTVTDGVTGCAKSGSGTVTVNALPTATVTGTNTICNGSSTILQAVLTGTGPWNVTWSDGVVSNGVVSSPTTRSVNPGNPYANAATNVLYTVTALADSNCSANPGGVAGGALVTINPLPTATVSGGGMACGGSSATIQAVLTGIAPWNVTWSDGVVSTNVVSSPLVRSVSPIASTNYTVTMLSDAGGCSPGALSGSAAVTVCATAPFQITSVQLLTADQLKLTWGSIATNVYQVQSEDSLSTSSWTTNATVTATAASTSWTNMGVSGVTQRYYRVVDTP